MYNAFLILVLISLKTKSLTLNEKEIYVSDVLLPSDGILITGLPNDTDYSDHSLMEMIKGFQKWRKVRMLGSAALAAAYVASGKADLYKEKRTYLWDVAAGAAIVPVATIAIAHVLSIREQTSDHP